MISLILIFCIVYICTLYMVDALDEFDPERSLRISIPATIVAYLLTLLIH